MIICEYKDGSSIRTYKTKQQRMNAITILLKMGYYCQIMASGLNNYSMKVFVKESFFYKDMMENFTMGVTFIPRRTRCAKQ